MNLLCFGLFPSVSPRELFKYNQKKERKPKTRWCPGRKTLSRFSKSLLCFSFLKNSPQCWNVLYVSRRGTTAGVETERTLLPFWAQSSAISVPPFLTRCPDIKVSDVLPCLHSFVPLCLPVCSHGLSGTIGKNKMAFSSSQSCCFNCRRLVRKYDFSSTLGLLHVCVCTRVHTWA